MTRSMKALLATALIATAAPVGLAHAEDAGVKAGVLNCTVAGGTGFIFGSSKTLSCAYHPVQGATEVYTGSITKFGIDVGVTNVTQLSWAVFAPSSDVEPGALEGDYAGVTAEATLGAGVGANALVGGLDKSVALNPLSVQVQTGLNVAAGIASLKLTSVQ
ncbi:DUF992 domain-containing protein [Breoghania sp. L-A4]|uniref:DUF992 domain-containing protein n=1 Tax=Breoghania sp. L-A4 TaxID=2304600 RepID=UPI0020C10A59|nr:DUF992 domain-containing protein [Breoghania sp. L-A4]